MSRRFATAVNGVLWVQTASGVMDTYDASPLTTTEVYSMRVRTGAVMVGPVPLAAGRCRGASVHGKYLGSHRLRMRILADNTERVILNTYQDVVADASLTTWPNDKAPEFRATVQRCHQVEVELIATPPTAEWTTVDVWVSGSDNRQPTTSRS